mgnify:CR=1 FL=1
MACNIVSLSKEASVFITSDDVRKCKRFSKMKSVDVFQLLAKSLAENEATIVAELSEAQGHPADIGGYYAPDPAKTTAVMRPSKTFNAALEKVRSGK